MKGFICNFPKRPLWKMIDWYLSDILSYVSFVIVILSSILGEKFQSMHLCTIPKDNKERIKYNQFYGVGYSHKYGIEHMLKQAVKFQRMKNELKIFFFFTPNFFLFKSKKDLEDAKTCRFRFNRSTVMEILAAEIQLSYVTCIVS